MYDKMGNITYLEHWLSSIKIDALEIQHIGNQIQNISPKKPITGFNYYFDSMLILIYRIRLSNIIMIPIVILLQI